MRIETHSHTKCVECLPHVKLLLGARGNKINRAHRDAVSWVVHNLESSEHVEVFYIL